MKLLKIMLIIIFLSGLAVPLLGCSSESDGTEPSESQIVTVQRGNLTIDITAAGNLALSTTEDSTFDLFYQEGTVGEVLVEEGDTVEEGQVLASLETSEWEDELSALDDTVTAAERQLTAKRRDLLQARINLQTAEQSLKDAQDNREVKELALLNAQISLEQAQQNLNAGIAATDYDAVKVELNRAKAWYKYVEDSLQESTDDVDDWLLAQDRAKERLETAQANYDNAISGYGDEEVAIKKKQVESAEMALAQAQINLDDVAQDITLKELQVTLKQVLVEDAHIAVEDADKDLEEAQEELEEAKSKSPVITAPFAGFITMVNVEGGDEVLKGTVALQLADPEKFEANIMVSEMDILQVKLGGEASVQVDAMSGLTIPAKVAHISPTATIQSGVVNYEVKVEVEPLEVVIQEQHATRQESMQKVQQGELPERFKQAVDSGQITQEQAEEMIKQMQQPQREQQEQVLAVMPEDFQLREGLTVTVSILVDERSDVLMVPNSAITRQGAQNYVTVESADGTREERAIQTGISDWQYTEVIEGLAEGEQVVVPQGTTATTTTQQGSGRGPMPFLPPH